mgnify:CR=1 FL=1
MKMPHYLLKSTYILIVIVVFSCNQEKNQDEKVTAVVQEPIVVYKNIHGFSEKDYEFDSSFVKSGESFGEILQRMDISYSSINKLSTTYKDVYDIRKIYYIINNIYQLDKLFLELKQQMNFIVIWFHLFLFMKNINQLL